MHTGRLRGLGRLAYLQTLALRVPRSHPPAHAHARHSTSNGSSLGSQTARHQVRISCKHLIYSDRLLRSSRSKLQHLQAISIHTGDPSIEQEEASFPIQKQSSIFSMRDVGERPTRDDLEKIAKSLGIHIRPDAKDDYVGALEGIHAAAEAVMAEPDFIPQADRKTYPRRDIHLPPKEELRQGWGYKATVEKHPPVDQGLLKGKTVVVKDTVMVADVPTLFGREVAGEYIATFDATAVKRILDAGGIITGKANCENWAWTYLSCLSPLSVIDNPLAPGFSAGGSSSGSAALIAGGHADLAIGGDQTGSLRVPASHCGLVGLKPTYGLVPATGVIAFEQRELSTLHVSERRPEKEIIGPMGRTVRDCAALLEAIAGKDHIDLRYTDGQYPDPIPRYVDALAASRRSNVSENRLKGIKIGILEEGFNGPGADPEICRIVKCAIRKFEALGAETSDKTCHGYVEAAQTLLVGTQVSAVATLKGQATGTKMLKLGSYFEKFLPWSSEALDRAPEVIKISMVQAEYLASNFPTAYDRSVNLVRRLSLSIDELLEEVDVIAMPTCVVRPRRHVPADAPLSRFSEAGAHMGVNTTPFSATTHPALTIPVGYTPPLDDDIEQPSDKDIKLPVGLQLVGRKYGELELLKVADAWEQAYGRGSLDAGPKNVKLPGTETDL